MSEDNLFSKTQYLVYGAGQMHIIMHNEKAELIEILEITFFVVVNTFRFMPSKSTVLIESLNIPLTDVIPFHFYNNITGLYNYSYSLIFTLCIYLFLDFIPNKNKFTCSFLFVQFK